MSRRRRLSAAPALAVIAAVISACGSSAAPAGNSTIARPQKGVSFSACMRHHGVGDFPDPDASGKLTIDAVANGSSIDTNAPAFTQALSACKALEPAGFTGGTRSAAQQAGALKFAQCMRESGVPDFPDPVNGQPLIDTNRIPSTNSPGGMNALHVAMQKCSGLGAAAGVTR